MELIIKQLDGLFNAFSESMSIKMPKEGWINTIRKSIGMSRSQLAKKLRITRQSVKEIEDRESEGTISLNTLRDVAHAMDLKLIYVLVPKDESLENLIKRKAREVATEIVMRTSNTMKLEDQEISKKRINEAIQERAEQLIRDNAKILWA